MRKSLFIKESQESLNLSTDHQVEHGFSKVELSKIHDKLLNGPDQPGVDVEISQLNYRSLSEADSSEFFSEFIKDSNIQSHVDHSKIVNEFIKFAKNKGLKKSEILQSKLLVNLLSHKEINCENVDHSQTQVIHKPKLKSSSQQIRL